jgi:uncharacterized repeat protein (TIGR03803 family)
MKTAYTSRTSRTLLATMVAASVIGLVPLCSGQLFTNAVEKVYDLTFAQDLQGNPFGGYAPMCKPTLVGTNLLFTTAKGGLYNLGTVSSFSLLSHQYRQITSLGVTLGGNTGSSPDSPITVDGTTGYFTCLNGGISNKGTIAKIDLTPGGGNYGAVTVLYDLTNYVGKGVIGNPRTGVTKIGDELWTMASLGGLSNVGAVITFSLPTGIMTVVTNFNGINGSGNIGGYPYANPILANGDYYFTTFVGGVSASGVPLGAGTLEKMRVDGSGNATITKLADMIPNDYSQFPCSTPCLVGTNSLYFMSTGPNASPGAIMRYDISAGTWATLWQFTNNVYATNWYGKQPGDEGMTEWQGDLYFLTRQGGTNNTGVVAKFNIASNTIVKLADLGGVGATSLGGNGGGFNNDGLVVMETNHYFMYYLVYAGGANTGGGTTGSGTIIRVYLPPQPLKSAVAVNNGSTTVSWTGGYPPYDILSTTNATLPLANWPVVASGINSATDTTNWSVSLPASTNGGYYLVRGQAQ